MKLNMSIQLSERAQLHIEATSLTELDQVRDYLETNKLPTGGLPAGNASAKEAAGTTSETSTKAPASTAGAAKGAGKGKDAKAADTAKTAAGPTIEEVTAALTEVADKFGVPEALNMNKRFGVKKAGELKAEQYADYIKFAKHCVEDKVEPSGSHPDFDGGSSEDDVSSLV